MLHTEHATQRSAELLRDPAEFVPCQRVAVGVVEPAIDTVSAGKRRPAARRHQSSGPYAFNGRSFVFKSAVRLFDVVPFKCLVPDESRRALGAGRHAPTVVARRRDVHRRGL